MDPFTILAGINTALTLAQQFIAAGKDVAPIISTIIGITSKGQNVTQADLDALQTLSDGWAAEIENTVLPDEAP